MKKILMVCEAFGGGVFSYVSQLCNDMCEEFDVYLAYSIRKQTPDNYKEFLNNKVKLIPVKNFGHLKNISKDISCIKELKTIEREIQPDVIHLHSSIAGAFGRIAFKKSKAKVVYTPHGYAHVLMGQNFKSFLFKIAEKQLGRIKNCITLTCCESEDKEASKLTKTHTYIETGLNVSDFSDQLSKTRTKAKSKFVVYTLGRICTQKQPRLFNEIAKGVPEADFLWIGDGELRNELNAKNILVTGWKSREEALSIAKTADVFILCSLGEAIAMSLLENMYLGKVCLVSNKMGNKSVIANNYNGYVCDDVEDYVQAIKGIIKSYPLNIAENAKNSILTTYNTDIMKRKFIAFYEKE
jgi:glycosyltransferase involved in cell wall biosynthesis